MQNSEKKCEIGGIKCFCDGCPKYEKRYKELFDDCDSIFDAAVDMQIFIAECLPKCKKRLDNPVI